MSDSDSTPKSRYDALPKMRTPSGRFVYDPSQAPKAGVDPATLRDMFDEAAKTEAADARAAVPQALEAKASDGAIVSAGDEAAKAHAEIVVAPHVVPEMPSAPVRITDVLDPRRQTTERRLVPPASPVPEPAAPSVWAREAKVPAIHKQALPPATAPRSQPPPSVATPSGVAKPNDARRDRRWLALPLGVAAMVMLAIFVLRGPEQPSVRPSASGTGTATGTAPAVASSVASVPATGSTASSAPAIEAPAIEVTPTSASEAPRVPPAKATVTPSAPPAKATAPFPKPSAAPKPSTKPSASPAPGAPPSAAPSAPPAPASTSPSGSDIW